MTYDDAMTETRSRTSPDPGAVARVRARLDAQLLPASAALAHLPSPSAAMVSRVRARLAAPRTGVPGPGRWLGVGGALVVGVGAVAAWLAQPAPPVDQRLGSTPVTLARGVVVTPDGSGHATGVADDVVIHWDAGRLSLSAASPVTVFTGEGTITVDHGELTLVRDALGTQVEHTSGTVETVCHEGGTPLCLPTTAAGWLARGRALAAQGNAPVAVLAALDEGLSRTEPHDGLLGELHAARIAPLLDLSDRAGALAAAESGLAVPSPRADSLHRTAARLRLATGDCAGALPHLEALEAPTPEERAHLLRCRQL